MVAGQLIAGLINCDHQSKVLAEAATLTTLQAKFDRLVSLETTDQATKRLNMTGARMVLGSSFSNNLVLVLPLMGLTVVWGTGSLCSLAPGLPPMLSHDMPL